MVDITDEDFAEEFDTFGVPVDNPDLCDKLRELCVMYKLDATDIAAQWVAYSHTNSNCAISQDNLDHLERSRLSKPTGKPSKTPVIKKPAMPVIYDITTIQQAVDADVADDLLGAYSTPGNKASKKRQHTPDNPISKRMTSLGRSPMAPFSPASFSPASATPSKKYSGRSNSSEVVCHFGASNKMTWNSKRQAACPVYQYDPAMALTQKVKYMFQKLTEKAHVLNDMLEEMGNYLKLKHDIEELSHVALPVQDCVTVVGRVCCDSNGKLNAKSVLLEGSRDTSTGKQIPVDLTEVRQYSLFPGQVVAMDGMNSTGSKFVVKKVYEGIAAPLPESKPQLEEGPLSVVIAAGPFTTSDSLMYEPLTDLVNYLLKETPDVCIFLGPFVDVKNQEMENLEVTYEELFKTTVLGQITTLLNQNNIQLIVVPSQRDIHHDCVYPQPPFVVNTLESKRIHFVSDPCTLSIDGVVFGITSTDVLFHLGAEEISSPPGSSDRLGRLTQHMLTQHNYYPLQPSAEEVNVDFDNFDLYGRMPVTPHILLVPSDLRYFIKDVCGCCCVNPGRLAKGMVGGTFARLVVTPGTNTNNSSLVQNIAAEVVRI